MPVRKTPEEMALAARLKVARSIVRLKHSLEADTELNALLSDISESHTKELQTGGMIQLNKGWADELLKDVTDEA